MLPFTALVNKSMHILCDMMSLTSPSCLIETEKKKLNHIIANNFIMRTTPLFHSIESLICMRDKLFLSVWDVFMYQIHILSLCVSCALVMSNRSPMYLFIICVLGTYTHCHAKVLPVAYKVTFSQHIRSIHSNNNVELSCWVHLFFP